MSLLSMLPWFPAIGIVAVGIRHVYRKFRTHDVIEVFVYDMATNHLPHIYHALQLLLAKEGIEMPDPPPLHFVDFRKFNSKDED